MFGLIHNFIFFIIIFLHPFIILNSTSNEGKYLYFLEQKDGGPLSKNFLKLLKEVFNVNTFVETGTLNGYTTERASLFFDKVLTIELDKKLYNAAKNKFKENKKVQVFEGDSKEVLKKILPTISNRALLFLDAHWSGAGTAKGNENTPILAELDAIKKSNLKNLIIVIDDLRFFQPKFVVDKQFKSDNEIANIDYPTLPELKDAIYKINPLYQFKIYGDMAIIYPKEENIKVSPIIESMTLTREMDLFDNNLIYSSQIIELEKNLKSLNDLEKNAIQGLFRNGIEVQRYFCTHYIFWNGLLLLFSNKLIEANLEFKKLINMGCKNTLIYKYLDMCKN